MSFTLNILDADLKAAEAIPDRVRERLDSPDLRLEMGRELQQVVKEHFEEISNDSAHHKTARGFGAKSTGVYEEAAQNTQQPELEADGVSVSVNQVAVLQRLLGGTINPVNAHWLTIPARAEAYGHRAREFDNLVPIFFRSGAGALVQRDATVLRGGGRGATRSIGLGGTRKGDEIGGGVFFWLVKSVTQEADPTVLPTDEEMTRRPFEAADRFVGVLLQQAKAA